MKAFYIFVLVSLSGFLQRPALAQAPDGVRAQLDYIFIPASGGYHLGFLT